MSGLQRNTTPASALVGLWSLALAAFIVGALAWARDLLMPLALAALIAFLLAPLVRRLERWLGRIGAVLMVVTLILGATATMGWVLTQQLVDLATNLPDYKENLGTKLRTLRTSVGGRFAKFTDAVEELKRDLPGVRKPEADPTTGRFGPSPPDARVEPEAPVRVIQGPDASPLAIARGILAPVLGPLGMASLVLLLVTFMLLKREDLRGRVVRLIGRGRISATTRAMDDAGARVTRYLLMQVILNAGYGATIAVGLSFIGLPNALLWGVCAALLRFVPYVGPWVGAAIPVALSLAVSPGWMVPLLTLGLFVLLELLSNQVLEPWLYGSSTGVSSIALIFAAVFWTWLWGPVGLVLATPLTVCLVVIGRHVPRLSFLSVLLSSEEALTPAQDCYFRLLTPGEQDEMELVEGFLKTRSLTALFDEVLLPVLSTVESDHRLDLVDDAQRGLVEQGLRDLVDDLAATPPALGTTDSAMPPPPPDSSPAPVPRIVCLPARAERDALAATMLVQLLKQRGIEARDAPARLEAEDLLERVRKAAADVVCISVVAPSSVLHARFLCLRIRALQPRPRIMVGLWGTTENVADASRRVRDSGADEVVTTLDEAVRRCAGAREAVPAP